MFYFRSSFQEIQSSYKLDPQTGRLLHFRFTSGYRSLNGQLLFDGIRTPDKIEAEKFRTNSHRTEPRADRIVTNKIGQTDTIQHFFWNSGQDRDT